MHLQDLNLSGNQINQLPEGMCALTALTMLSLHGNQLQQIPQHGWEQLTDLKEVTLQGNRLTGIPDSFAQLRVRYLLVLQQSILLIIVSSPQEGVFLRLLTSAANPSTIFLAGLTIYI